MMAVIQTFSIQPQGNLDPHLIVSGSDATGLAGGGIAVTGNHFVPSAHNDTTLFNSVGGVAGTSNDNVGFDPAIAELSNGNLVVVGDGGDDIFFTILNASGGTVLASTGIGEGGEDVLEVDVAGGLSGDRFVIAYRDYFGSTDSDIGLSIHNNNGTFVTAFAVDSSGANDQAPSVATLINGNFAVAWHRSVEGGATQLWYAVYDAAGGVVKAPTLLDPVGTINRNPSVVALADGGFAIAYEDNGWSPGTDIDISYATFSSAGTNRDIVDISRNTYNDTLPSTTLLSNGLVFIGSTNDASGNLNPTWTLVGANTGDRLAEAVWGGTPGHDTQTAVAGMSFGRVGAFFSNLGSGDVVGQILEVWRKSTGDSADDVFIGDDLFDWVIAGDGNDVIAGGPGRDFLEGQGGDDTFQFQTNDIAAGEYVHGGAGFDRIVAFSSISFLGATLYEIEEIEFHSGTLDPISVTLRWDQAPFRILIDGRDGLAADILKITIGSGSLADLSSWEFVDVDPSSISNDRVVIIGDDDNERIIGSPVADEIFGNGGSDLLNGFLGTDILRGGGGDDTYIVDKAGDRVFENNANGGVDLVKSSVSFKLGANLENLTLTGTAAINGTGNGLANIIIGNSAANILHGRAGADDVKGGGGADVFLFNDGDFGGLTPSTCDRIIDFSSTGGDLMDLSGVDANSALGGDQAFNFVGTGAFTGTAGQLRYEQINGNTYVYGDTDGDGVADFMLRLDGSHTLNSGDFVI